MAYEPCKNPNCKSYGKPHPNCRCYGSFADGGEVGKFCDSINHHDKDCEYFSEDSTAHLDAHHATSGYIAAEGLHGLLGMHQHDPEVAMEKYNRSVKKGHKAIERQIEHTFHGGKSDFLDLTKAKNLIDEWVSKGALTHDLNEELYKQNDPQDFAEGGEVKKKREGIHGHPIETAHPHHNIMLQSLKGTASNYLTSLKPQSHESKLAFDDAPDQSLAKKSYDRALNIAAHPMTILDKVKKGTIEPEHIKHFNALHPELNGFLQKKITEKITHMQMKGEKPSYKVRQGLSMLLGTTLSSEMTPANIQAAQASFQTQGGPSPQGGGNAPMKKTSAIAKAPQSYMTANVAAASRQQKQ